MSTALPECYCAVSRDVSLLLHRNLKSPTPDVSSIFTPDDMSVDESSLTGENRPVEKTCVALPSIPHSSSSSASSSSSPPPPPLSEQKNIAFMGTLVVSGRGRGLVVAVGCRTEFGKVAKELGMVESRRSPLQTKIDELGRTLAFASGVGISVLALVGIYPWFVGHCLRRWRWPWVWQ